METIKNTAEELDKQPMAEPVEEPAAAPAEEPGTEPVEAAHTEPAAASGGESDAQPAGKVRKKRSPLWIVLLILLLLITACATAAGAYVLTQLNEREAARQQADELKDRGEYAQALDAYARLMEDDRLSFTPFENAYVCAGADGVVDCADALLETSEGAHYLLENQVLTKALSHATHPAVPASLAPSLERRSLLCEAILAQEAGDLTKALELLQQAGLRKELSYPIESVLDREAALAAAHQARAEGRYEDAIAILTSSVLEPELVVALQQQIIDEEDTRIRGEARTALAALDLDGALQALKGLSREDDRDALRQEFAETWNTMLTTLHGYYQKRLQAGVWYTFAMRDKPLLTGDKRYGTVADSLQGGTVVGGLISLAELNKGRVRLLGDTMGADKTAAQITDAKDAALGLNHGLVLHADGTVTNLGATQYGRAAVAEWTDIVQVAAGGFHSLGLRADGTVAAAGLDLDGQCQVGEWTDVVSIAAGLRHSVALRADGRVLAVGDNSFGQCDVSGWENIIDIRCGGDFTLGLTADWRLLAVGDNGCGQCDVSGWQEVLAFDGGLWHTVALLSDGRIVTAGANDHGQGGLSGTSLFESGRKLSRPASSAGAETELVYTGHPTDGPWLYVNNEGCLVIAFDEDTGKMRATRADLICTDGHPPVGILSGGGDKPALAVHASTLAKQNRAVFAITGDYFTFGYNADGLQIRRGVVFKEEKDEVGFSFFPDGSMRIVDPETTTAQDLLDQGIRDCWVFGPTLILNGEAQDIHTHPLSYNDVTMRTVVASLCPYHHIAVAYGSCTLAQVTENLLSYGCDIAYNLDGGRSCMMAFMGNIINRSMYIREGWRGLQDMVGFLTSDLVPEK